MTEAWDKSLLFVVPRLWLPCFSRVREEGLLWAQGKCFWETEVHIANQKQETSALSETCLNSYQL